MNPGKVLDTYPLIALFDNQQPSASRVEEILEQAGNHENPLYLSVVNWGEVYYISCRNVGKARAEKIMRDFEMLPIQVIDADRQLTSLAAEIKSEGGISYPDCFAAALAKMKNVPLVTGDKEFRRVEGFIKILWV